MTDIDFTRDMTPEEIALAKEAGAIAARQLKGQTMLDGLKVGEQLLHGRQIVLKKYGLNSPRGRSYGAYFQAWKRQFGFPVDFANSDEEKKVLAYFDDAIVCAAHRNIAEEIMYQEDARWRANNGVSGLARRVRNVLRDKERERSGDEGEAEANEKPKTKSRDEINDELREEASKLRIELMQEQIEHGRTKQNRAEILRDPLSHYQGDAAEAANRLFENRNRAERIMRALATLFGLALVPADTVAPGAVEAIAEHTRAIRKQARIAARSSMGKKGLAKAKV